MKDGLSSSAYVAMLMTALLSLFCFVWTYTATQRDNFLPAESGPWRAHLQMIARCDVGDVVILGSSRANAAFVPKLLGVNATNLAMTGSTPIEAYYEAREIYRCPHPPKAAILGFAGLDLERTDWFWERSARFGLLNFRDLQDIGRHALDLNYPDLYRGAFGSEPPPLMKNWLYANHFPPYDFASLLAAKSGGFRHKDNMKWVAETLANRGWHVVDYDKCARKPAFEAGQSAFKPSTLHAYYFDRLIKILQQHGAEVLFMAPPLTPLTYHGLHGTYVQDYNAFLRQTEVDHPGFQVIGPTFSSLDLCDFSDSNHLNQAGAEKFSRQVAPLISAAIGPDR